MINAGIISPVAVAIPFDNSTNGFTATNVQTAIEEAATHQPHTEVSATASASAPTGADVLLNSMTISPSAGVYVAWFSTDVTSGVAGATISLSFYVGGTQDAASLRKIIPFSGGTLTSGNARGAVAFQRTVTITAGQALEVRWSTSNAGPTAAARTMTIVRVG